MALHLVGGSASTVDRREAPVTPLELAQIRGTLKRTRTRVRDRRSQLSKFLAYLDLAP